MPIAFSVNRHRFFPYYLPLLFPHIFRWIRSTSTPTYQMLASMALSVYMSCSVAAFYLRLTHPDARQENPYEAQETEELN